MYERLALVLGIVAWYVFIRQFLLYKIIPWVDDCESVDDDSGARFASWIIALPFAAVTLFLPFLAISFIIYGMP